MAGAQAPASARMRRLLSALTQQLIDNGPRGLLPPNLSDELLAALADGIPTGEAETDCIDIKLPTATHRQDGASLLLAAVTWLRSAQQAAAGMPASPVTFTGDGLYDALTSYGLAVSIERLHRDGCIGDYSRPTLSDILNMDREVMIDGSGLRIPSPLQPIL